MAYKIENENTYTKLLLSILRGVKHMCFVQILKLE